MKKYILLGILSIMVVGCSNAPKKVELTPTEVKELGNNQNAIASTLIKKAVLKEMSEYKYTPEESKAIKQAKENLEIEFYLDRVATKRVNVTDEQVVALYEANKEQLKDIKAEVALPQIKEQLILQQVNNEKVNYINSLVEKYNLNEKFKSYSVTPAVTNPQTVTTQQAEAK